MGIDRQEVRWASRPGQEGRRGRVLSARLPRKANELNRDGVALGKASRPPANVRVGKIDKRLGNGNERIVRAGPTSMWPGETNSNERSQSA